MPDRTPLTDTDREAIRARVVEHAAPSWRHLVALVVAGWRASDDREALLDEVDRLRAEKAQAWSEGHATAMAAMLNDQDALAAKLDAVRAIPKMGAFDSSMIGQPHRQIAYAQGWDMVLNRVAQALGDGEKSR